MNSKKGRDKQSINSDELFNELNKKEGESHTKFDFQDFISKKECTSYYFGKLQIEQKGYICSICDKKKKKSYMSFLP